jgi:hypothetical protein
MLHVGPAERAFNSMIRNAKANALSLNHRVARRLRRFSRQNRPFKPKGLSQGADDFPRESTLKKVVPLT